MNLPLVSIALCTYNGSRYLEDQLNSLASQTYPNLEIIVVDDHSSDNTVEILRRYTANFPTLNIKIFVNKDNLGYIGNFEKAIGLCSGEYIALCDQDDIWDAEKINLMVRHIGDHMLIYHDSEFIDEAGKSLNKKISDVRNCYSGSDSRVFLFENSVSGHAMLFRKELLNYTDRFKKEIFHDWWLAYMAADAGSVLFLDKVLVKYRQHNTASTNILRENRDTVKKPGSLEKMEKQLRIVQLFASYPFNKEKDFKSRLLLLMERRMNSYFCFPLVWFMFRNRGVLLYIQKKSAFSKLNFVLKHLWGGKIKKIFS